MENNSIQRISGMLGFAMRARKLVLGTDLVCRAMPCGNVKLVVISEGASDATKKKLSVKSEYYGIPYVEVKIDTEQLGKLLGKSSLVAAVAVLDSNFAEQIIMAASCHQNS